MVDGYTEIPHNMTELVSYVTTQTDIIVTKILAAQKCYFYDTCSFRRHSNLRLDEADYLLKYIKKHNGIFIITRCILMELASNSGTLKQQYIQYIKHISEFGIPVLVMYEEDLFSVMEVCFSTNATINSYLCWTMRTMKLPVSTITSTLQENSRIHDEVIKGKNLDNKGIYKRFFDAVRKNKVAGDNLGEELLAICLHTLSYLPGEEDGKFCVITDDKEAAGKIDTLFKTTAKHYRGKKIIIFSTPKLVQILYRENVITNPEQIQSILKTGTEGNIIVLGTLIYDIRSTDISLSADELTKYIMQPNGIHIIF